MIAVVALAALLIGFSKAGLAGSVGPFVTVLFALTMPADDAIGLLLPMLIFADMFAVGAHWRRWEGSLLPPLLVSATGGILLGTFVLASISEVWLQRLIGIAMLGFALFYIVSRGIELPHGERRRWAVAAGSTAGLTSAIAHSGGPPIIVYLMAAGLEPRRFVATSAVFFSALNLIKVPGYFYADLFDAELIVSTLWGWLLVPVGVVLGRLLVTRINRQWFERVMLSLLIVGSVALLVT